MCVCLLETYSIYIERACLCVCVCPLESGKGPVFDSVDVGLALLKGDGCL